MYAFFFLNTRKNLFVGQVTLHSEFDLMMKVTQQKKEKSGLSYTYAHTHIKTRICEV